MEYIISCLSPLSLQSLDFCFHLFCSCTVICNNVYVWHDEVSPIFFGIPLWVSWIPETPTRRGDGLQAAHLSGVHELCGVDVEELLGVLEAHVRRLHQLRVGRGQRDPLYAAVPGPATERCILLPTVRGYHSSHTEHRGDKSTVWHDALANQRSLRLFGIGYWI